MMDCAKANVIASLCALAAFSYFGCAAQSAGGGASSAPEGSSPPPESEAEMPLPPADETAQESNPATADESGGGEEDETVERDASETRTTEAIAVVVKAHRDEARACYEKVLKDVPGLKGDLVIHFVLNPDGTVKTAQHNEERSTIKEPAVVSCVVDVIAGIKFPESSRGMETKVNYPFNFNP